MKILFCNNISKTLVLTFTIAMATHAETIRSVSTFATGAAVTATGPDSITVGGGFVWVSYTNGADSTGASGSSTVVQYDMNGVVRHTYSIAGSVDGLKIEPETGLVWALQNQDGNSTLTLIDPRTGIKPNSPLHYKVASSTRGYDDVAFREGQIFLSYTNPNSPTDPTIQRLENRTSPLIVTPVLTMGATGVNLATDKPNQPTSQSDPDSLKLTPGGGLMLTSGADGQLIFVLASEDEHSKVAFLSLLDPKRAAVTGLDDALFATSGAGTFYLTDTGNNRVLKIEAQDIAVGTLYACVGSLNEFGKVNLETGVVTSVVNSLKAPHGLAFVPKSDDENEGEDHSGDR
jgi:hypothetical protein